MAAGPADQLAGIFKGMLWDALVSMAANKFIQNILGKFLINLFGQAFGGFLLGPFGWIAQLAFSFFGNKIFIELKNKVNLEAIEFLNEKEQKEFDRASANLKAIARSEGIDSEAFKEAARVQGKEFSDFIKFGVARS